MICCLHMWTGLWRCHQTHILCPSPRIPPFFWLACLSVWPCPLHPEMEKLHFFVHSIHIRIRSSASADFVILHYVTNYESWHSTRVASPWRVHWPGLYKAYCRYAHNQIWLQLWLPYTVTPTQLYTCPSINHRFWSPIIMQVLLFVRQRNVILIKSLWLVHWPHERISILLIKCWSIKRDIHKMHSTGLKVSLFRSQHLLAAFFEIQTKCNIVISYHFTRRHRSEWHDK